MSSHSAHAHGGAAVARTRVEVRGVNTRVVMAGPPEAREAVVFVHGNPGSADDWEQLVQSAGEITLAVAFDLPDFGDTSAPAGFQHTVEGYSTFLGELIGTLGIERVHLVLHDFGGPIGLAWMASHVDRMASLTLIDIGLLPGYRWHRLARVWRTPLLGELFQSIGTRSGFGWALSRSEPKGLPGEFIDRMWGHYDKRTRRAVLELYRSVDDPGSGAKELAALMAPRDLPALVVWGEGDKYLPSSYAARQREAFPSAQVHVLADSGHWPFVDAPDAVGGLLVEFLRGQVGVMGEPVKGAEAR